MNNFCFVTPERFMEMYPDGGSSKHTLKDLKKILNRRTHKCETCGVEDEWKFAGTGMCFTCTTGESDASQDYELATFCSKNAKAMSLKPIAAQGE